LAKDNEPRVYGFLPDNATQPDLSGWVGVFPGNICQQYLLTEAASEEQRFPIARWNHQIAHYDVERLTRAS